MGNIDHKLILADAYAPKAVGASVQSNPATGKDFMIDTGDDTTPGLRGRYSAPLRLVVKLQEDAVGSAATTVQFHLFATNDPDASTLGEEIVARTVAIGADGVKPGKLVDIPLPRWANRYLKLRTSVVSAALTSGTFTAYISEGGD